MCVSQKSRLAVVMEAAPYASFPLRGQDAVCEVLKAIGITDANVEAERLTMNHVVLAKTADKSILGTINDYRLQLEYHDDIGRFNLLDRLKILMHLSKVISLDFPEGYPMDATLKLFDQQLSTGH